MGSKAVRKDNSGLKIAKYRYEKALSQRLRAYQLSGGTDGARTRDPLRDRQVARIALEGKATGP